MAPDRPISPRLEESEPLQRCGFPDCKAACCVYRAWVDKRRAGEILARAELIQPHMPEERRAPDSWFDAGEEPDPYTPTGTVVHTTVVADRDHYGGTTCIFMRPDYKCALQVAAERNGFHPWRFKPFFCVLRPLDIDERGRLTLDRTQDLLAEPASCLRPSSASIPLKRLFSAELSYLTAPNT